MHTDKYIINLYVWCNALLSTESGNRVWSRGQATVKMMIDGQEAKVYKPACEMNKIGFGIKSAYWFY